MKQLVRTLGVAALLVSQLAGCAMKQQAVRSELQLAGASSAKLDGLSIEATLLDYGAVQRDPRLTTGVWAGRAPFVSSAAGASRQLTLLNAPVIVLKVANKTGHVLPLKGMIAVLVDGAGKRYGLETRSIAAAELVQAIQRARADRQEISPEQASAAMAGLDQLKLFGEDVQLLPDEEEIFFAAFALPIVRNEESLEQWLAEQRSLKVAIYDLPTRTDAAGTVTKRSSVEFPIAVKSFRETYELGFTSHKLLAREEVSK